MKKLILFTYIILFISFAALSQSLSLIYNGNPVTYNDSVIQMSGNALYTVALNGLVVKNKSTSGTVTVKVKKVIIDTLAGTTNSICFGINCYPASVYVAPSASDPPVTIAVGATNTSFTGDYVPNGIAGATTVRYVFFNSSNVNDTASVKVIYNGLSGIEEIHKSEIVFHDAYPNPSNSFTTINYTLPKQTSSASIVIRNILGSEVMVSNLEELSGRKTINTSDLKDGIYFYSLLINDKIYYTRKLVVRH